MKETKKFSLKAAMKGKSMMFCSLLLILAMAVMFFQNEKMLGQIEKILGESDTEVHEVYDDTAVLKAYRSGDAEGLSAEDSFVLEKAKEVIGEIVTDNMTDYEKEKAVYEWQVAWVNYDNDNLSPVTGGADQSHLPYGVLKNHEAICVGNATTFKLFMDMLDIPCQIIHSTQTGEHAWNVVQLDDDWYHVDVTFDGSTNGTPNYTYFNVPDSVKDDGSWPWDHSKIPAANGTKYCYMLNEAATLDNIYQIPQALVDAAESGSGFVSIILKDNQDFTREVADYISNNMMIGDRSLYYNDAYSIDGKTVYCYIFESSSEEPTGDSSEVMKKLNEKILEVTSGLSGTVDYSTDGEYAEAVG